MPPAAAHASLSASLASEPTRAAGALVVECPAGTYSIAGAESCSDCEPGEYQESELAR